MLYCITLTEAVIVWQAFNSMAPRGAIHSFGGEISVNEEPVSRSCKISAEWPFLFRPAIV
jgi:hypothetical protein